MITFPIGNNLSKNTEGFIIYLLCLVRKTIWYLYGFVALIIPRFDDWQTMLEGMLILPQGSKKECTYNKIR